MRNDIDQTVNTRVQYTEVIRCERLTKQFKGKAALDGLDLTVRQGEIFGFLGPNGAGKTTTIRLLLGLIRADSGVARLFGDRVPCPWRLREVGAMVEEPAFYPWLSGRENLQVLLDSGAPSKAGAIDTALDRVGLSAVAGNKVKTYSQGMRQRLGLGAALLRDPRLLVLDEPANGLDPAGIRDFRMLLRRLADDGVTVFLSSHLLGEVEQVCDRIAVLNRGRLVAVGAIGDLGPQQDRVRIAVRLEDDEATARVLAPLDAVREGSGVFVVPSRNPAREINGLLAQNGIYAESIGIERSGLEESFLALTSQEGRDAAAQG